MRRKCKSYEHGHRYISILLLDRIYNYICFTAVQPDTSDERKIRCTIKTHIIIMMRVMSSLLCECAPRKKNKRHRNENENCVTVYYTLVFAHNDRVFENVKPFIILIRHAF